MGDGTELGRVRGLGSAQEGAHHWWRQRVTAGSNLFFLAWFMISLTRLGGFDYGSIHNWIASAWVAVPLIMLVISTCWHARLGLQVLIEDYQDDEGRVLWLLVAEYFLAIIAVTAIFSILKAALVTVAAAGPAAG
ncbi:succinate dehydrogenase, hydrophobic membrane anchor protein [Sphingomonas panacisoli]|uniref:Succinate dehydrogenase hydrophobic membrane anchor subunit n=1 Tax=Sphingomonas panacisoli TaxID=1813879 RepID=A0A5B8LF12_9SPHN|nr:succinate dehydrogenase, hydrophobic membrane anchor protein [Sphingomonas panacisoli]QDZ06314.1 succinate dehydrogenase, hydrophobic membrane anchor protein [Sphingomonas panacisoli]